MKKIIRQSTSIRLAAGAALLGVSVYALSQAPNDPPPAPSVPVLPASAASAGEAASAPKTPAASAAAAASQAASAPESFGSKLLNLLPSFFGGGSKGGASASSGKSSGQAASAKGGNAAALQGVLQTLAAPSSASGSASATAGGSLLDAAGALLPAKAQQALGIGGASASGSALGGTAPPIGGTAPAIGSGAASGSAKAAPIGGTAPAIGGTAPPIAVPAPAALPVPAAAASAAAATAASIAPPAAAAPPLAAAPGSASASASTSASASAKTAPSPAPSGGAAAPAAAAPAPTGGAAPAAATSNGPSLATPVTRAAGTAVNQAVGTTLITPAGSIGSANTVATPIVRSAETATVNSINTNAIKPAGNAAAGAVPGGAAPVVRAVEATAATALGAALLKPGAPLGLLKSKKGVPTTAPAAGGAPAVDMAGKVVGAKGGEGGSAFVLPEDNSQLLSLDVLRSYDLKRRRNIQAALLEIFADDPDYVKARALPSKPLSDDMVGPVTLSFITRFWLFYNMEAAGNVTEGAVDAMLHFAKMLAKHPEWKGDLLNVAFIRWIDSRPLSERLEDYWIVRTVDEANLPPLLTRFHRSGSAFGIGNDVDAEPAPLSVYWYGLTADDFKTLGAKAALVPGLAPLKDESFASKPLFDAAVLAALKLTPEQGAPYLPSLEHDAEGVGYQLTAKSIQNLRSNATLPRELVDAAAALRHDVYVDRADMQQALKEAGDKAGAKWDAQLPLVVAEAEQTKIYSLTDASFKSMAADAKNQPVSPIFLKMIGDLQGVQYPRRSLFDKAVLFRLRNGLGACPGDTTSPYKRRQVEQKISAEDLAALKEQVGDVLAAKINALTTVGDCEEAAKDAMNVTLGELYAKYSPSIGEHVRKAPSFDQGKNVQWTGQLCGCMADQLQGEVYGFYPFWLAGAPQQVNFRLVSRIGYYGVTFDEQGVMRMANDGRDINEILQSAGSPQTAFINEARQHRTKFDWVIHKTDWDAFGNAGDGKKRQIFEQLSNNIINFLSTKLTDWRSVSRPYISFGLGEVPDRGDGVTLYFDNFPRDETSIAIFNTFVDKLHQRLLASGHDLTLAMRKSEMGKGGGIYSYSNLLGILNRSPKQKNMINLPGAAKETLVMPKYLVFMEEPTSDSKKALRADLEAALHGEERLRLVRQLVPVIEFGKKEWAQFEDDLIYFGDNFGGAGFWPLTINKIGKESLASVSTGDGVQHCDASKTVENCIEDYFQLEKGVTSTALPNFVCENRWSFRFVIGLCLIFLVVCGVVYWQSCRWRLIIEKYYYVPIAIGVIIVIDFGLMIRFDPYLQHLARGHLISALLAGVIVCIVLYYRQKFKMRDERP
jgi:hypothetical protein